MGKSSSLKKKRSKDSSKSRMRKRSKVKSKKSKSKKLRRGGGGDDSISYSSDSDSASMVSVSSFSSQGDCTGRRSRSRNRKDTKGGKKRSRRRSSGSEDSPSVKKRRGSRRGNTRKRTGKRKKSMRDDVSVSSRSSRSLSCSTCPSDNDEIEYEKRRGRPERKEKYRRRSEKVKRGSKRSKGQSRGSSCSRDSEGSDHLIEERIMEDSNFRRLKSVITVVEQVDESIRELIADEPKEDVYDYDDYTSCRSNDSNDGCSQRELQQHTHAVSETIKPPDDEQVEVSNVRTSNVEVINVSSATDGLKGDDIESILRQRALENLKKFRGELQKNINPPITPNDKSVGDVKTPSSVNTDSFQIKAPKADDGRVVIASQVSQQIRQPLVRRDSSTLSKDDRNTTNTNDDGKHSETPGRDVALPSARLIPTGIPGKEVNTGINSVSKKPRLVISRTGLKALNACNIQKQEAVTQEPSRVRLVVDEGDLETAQAVKPSDDNAASVSNRQKFVKLRIGQEPPNTFTIQEQESAALESPQAKFVTECSVKDSNLRTAQTLSPKECVKRDGKDNDTRDSTCDKPSPSGNISSDKQEDETKGGSQFQQKMMSVMRGGEMVQVSYQVYIPKRAPALARRQLKR